ncbi:hypothetical protein AB0E25_38610, partial [Streptomyces bobili]
LLVAVAVALVLTTRSGGGGSGGDSEVFLQAAERTGSALQKGSRLVGTGKPAGALLRMADAGQPVAA